VDRSIVFARLRQSAYPPNTWFFSPQESAVRTPFRSVHPFVRGSPLPSSAVM